MGVVAQRLMSSCREIPSNEPQVMMLPEIVRSKTELVKSRLSGSTESTLHKSITADFKGKLVNDVQELSAKGSAEEVGVSEYCQKLLKKYKSSRSEELRLRLGYLNVRTEDNTGDPIVIREPILMSDFSIYIGQWGKTGKRSGTGLVYLPDGSIYEGQWLLNLPSGEGRLIFSSCDYYEGQFELGSINGRGKLYRADGSYYEGNWVNSLPHGAGREEWPDGQFYEGDYRCGKKHGFGRFLWESASYYEGEFQDNRIQGKGVCVWSNGRKYAGEWKNNLMHGQGKFETNDGRSYEGQYVEGQKQGVGIYTWSSGKRYEGGWASGQQHGAGFIFEPGSTQGRKGIWENGKRLQWIEE
mmetsp:Transcript_12133/g.23047  ORF Transcript_12133/g.23047 Transcript_12133/m.23047 type:complete len:355 (-) Transcript_12133:151-1215(-)|eukprot:CAMPEP_0204912312 /NCGR_PEP_ID=MMETSP1397-20131031/10483_1 /ASSEMBLY_ACC=CAM_ASM_000891 /TAXON_ID=49980 /ORGANISM="Climacostomum Climacostomum virens, Strain Stock W-24" /LENGTH=354 /DNA_ID=CAMNT_0052083213 /DNA_START=152 /DNA_END=1216 /DNA_ORIENTATION=+